LLQNDSFRDAEIDHTQAATQAIHQLDLTSLGQRCYLATNIIIIIIIITMNVGVTMLMLMR